MQFGKKTIHYDEKKVSHRKWEDKPVKDTVQCKCGTLVAAGPSYEVHTFFCPACNGNRKASGRVIYLQARA